MVNPFNADAIASTVVDIVIKKQIFDFLLEVAKVGWWLLMIERTNVRRDERYQRTQMQKEAILDALRAKGLRITKQRKIILDIILGEDCSCCKEIYFQASKIDKKRCGNSLSNGQYFGRSWGDQPQKHVSCGMRQGLFFP